MTTLLIGAALVIGLTAVTGYFVLQEFAYVAVDPARLRRIAGDKHESVSLAAQRALRITSQVSFMLSGAQLGITVTALLVGYAAEPFLAEGLAKLLGSTGVSESISLPLSLVLGLVFATGIQMVLGELVPKNLAIARPERLAVALSRSTLLYLALAGPVIRLFDSAANRLVRAVGIAPIEELPQGATSDELSHIITTARASGQLSVELFSLLDRGLNFHQRTAAQAMVPRVDVTTIAAQSMVSDVVAQLRHGRSRFPVIAGSVDDVIGVVGMAEVLRVPPANRASTSVGSITSPALLIPSGVHLPEVLDTLRNAHRQLACVVDEFGGFAGVITLEDIAEELVGEIRDEDDPVEAAIARRPDGSWLIPAGQRMDQICHEIGLGLPTNQPYETLGGLVMAHLGRIPVPGDDVLLTGVRRLDTTFELSDFTVAAAAVDTNSAGDDSISSTVAVQLTVVAVHRRTAQTVLARELPDSFTVTRLTQ
ncbi:MAG: hemolysin family protein [Mycobacteriales bacterium]